MDESDPAAGSVPIDAAIDATIGTATTDTTLDGASLQASIDALEAAARALDLDIAHASDVAAVRAIGAAQAALRAREQALVDAQITLVAGDLAITAGHIDAAARYATDAIAAMKAWKARIDAAAALVAFFGVVMTGDGAAILSAAVTLKSALSTVAG